MCKIFGRKKEDIIGKHLSDNFFTKDSVETIPLEFERLWQGETIVKQRTVKRPDGSTIEIEMHTKMFPDGTLQSFFHDITDKKQAEKQILEEKTKALLNYANLQAVIENTTDNIWAIDTQYRILYLNKNFKTNFKEVFETDLYLGVNILDCLEKSYSEFWKEKYDLVINNNQRLQFEQEIPLKENFIFISVSLNPILKDNKVIGVACFGSDITKRKNEEKELIKALNRAEESEKLKSAFQMKKKMNI
jgi:PAS domain S-box-containing protein